MADVGIVWSVSEDGLDDFENFLDHAERESKDMNIPLHRARDHVQYMIFGEFFSDGARSGGWVPLDHHYDMWKITKGEYEILKLDPLFLHGEPGSPRDEMMFDVLMSDSSWDITTTDAVFEPDSSRAVWHQEGVPVRGRGGGLSARPFLVFEPQDYDEIHSYFEDWVGGVLLDPAFPGANVGRSSIGTFLPLGPF